MKEKYYQIYAKEYYNRSAIRMPDRCSILPITP